MASALFRLIAAVGRDLNVALTFGSFVLAILFAMSGFVLSKGRTITVCLIIFYILRVFLSLFLLYSLRQYKKMVDMGILDLTYDVWAKCHG
jgi:hypothetical protein